MTNAKTLGYNKPLFILPFDHRSSFEEKMFGIKTKELNDFQKKEIIDEKKIIYQAFQKAIFNKIPKEQGAILIDEEYGDEILKDGISKGFNVCLTTEKSGQEEFDFEYGNNFKEHIEKYKPKFVKALVRYNPEGEREVNKRQEEKLKLLNDYCLGNNYNFLLEILIPPTKKQLEKVNESLLEYEETIKPELTTKAISALKNSGINPDVFKLEGMNKSKDYKRVVLEIEKDGGENVGVVVLGRGEKQELVEKWIIEAAGVKGVIGFAIGRTIFWQPLVEYRNKKITRNEAIDKINNNYQYFYQLFIDNKSV
jgi:5-dehydro-2-deoxygluconokinase